MTATLKVTRETGFRIELRRGQFEISVDGNRAGTIEEHQTFETTLEPGSHTLRVRKGRYSSRSRGFEAAEGEVLRFRCHGASIWPTWLLSFAVPSLAISLRPD